MSSTSRRVLVVGGGAAGLMAAASAAKCGACVTVLERMDRPARKVLLTGNGRCNVTTALSVDAAVAAFGTGVRFLHGAFSRFFADDMIAALGVEGVEVKLEEGARYFPASGRASDVADALVKMVRTNGGRILAGHRVEKIVIRDGCIAGVAVAVKKRLEEESGNRRDVNDMSLSVENIEADCVILATGGMSYPGTGSSGDGYSLALEAGHRIIEPRAGLVPVELEGDVHTALSPLSLKNARVRLLRCGKMLREETGEMMFTHFGATGPVVLNMSRHITGEVGGLELEINFLPEFDETELREKVSLSFASAGKKTVKSVLETILPKRAVPVILAVSGVTPDIRGVSVTRDSRESIARNTGGLRFAVKGTRPIAEAMVTAGGVCLDEVNPRTMESKLIKGLFICGELLDIDGPSGGFNLQAAFSTGNAAGVAAAGGQ